MKTIRVAITGGLGNQLFQYSAGIFLKNKYPNLQIKYDVSGFYRLNLMSKILIKLKKQKIYKRDFLLTTLIPNRNLYGKTIFAKNIYKEASKLTFVITEDSAVENALKKVTESTEMVFGYFQNSKLVEEIWPLMRNELKNSKKFSQFLNPKPIKRIAIHLRFGDYYDNLQTKNFHGITNTAYYLEAINYFESKFESEFEIIVVTDNVDLARSFFNIGSIDRTISFVSTSNPLLDLFEISQSTHVIITNSTFSWWGAWFAYKSHGANVIYPRPWFADETDPDLPIYHDNWIPLKRKFLVT